MPENKPLVSIIALNYNQSEFLEEGLNSFADQSYRNFELIITDDCSTDDSREKIDKWIAAHPGLPIRKIYNSANRGLCATLNIAVKASNGEFIKPIACDDTMQVNYLEETINFFQKHPDVSLLCTDMQLMDEKSDIKHSSNWKYGGVNISEENINDFEAYLFGPFLNTPSLIYRRGLYDKIGGYDEELAFEDWDFLLRSKKEAKFSFIDSSLVNYRMHASNMHHHIGRKVKYSQDIIKLLRKHLNTSLNADKKIRKKICDELYGMLMLDEKTAIGDWSELYRDIQDKESVKKPLVSVLASSGNSGEFIAQAIESVLLQTYSHIELIIVADPCTDKTVDIIKSFVSRHNNIILHQNQESKGLFPSLNIGLEHCKGAYIAITDLDDLCHPQRLEREMELMLSNDKTGVVTSWVKTMDENRKTGSVEYSPDKDVNKVSMLFGSPFSHGASLFKTSVLKQAKYREEYAYAADYDLWFRLLVASQPVEIIREYLYLKRIHPAQVSKRHSLTRKDAFRKIAANILNLINVSSSSEELEFHLDHVMLEMPVENVSGFLKYDMWMTKILKADSRSEFFNGEKFKSFVFANYWQEYYLKYRKELKGGQLIRVLNSPFNLYGIKQKSKDILKQFVNR